jgi:protein SCO1/2
MAVNMSELYELYRSSDMVQFVSISVDPDRDSLEALIEYGRSLRVDDNRWVFLRAPVEQVIAVCEEQFMLPAEALPMGHTTKFILVDQHGQIRSYHEGLKNESMLALKNNIRQIAREMP